MGRDSLDDSRAFRPPWWLQNKHLQTCFAPLLAPHLPDLTWHEMETPDGDFMDICWCGDASSDKVVCIFTGLEGSVDSHYVRALLKGCIDRGWQAVVMHYRGCSGRLNRLPRAYHSDDVADHLLFLRYVTAQRPDAVLFAVGCSMGGALLIKALAQSPTLPVTRAVVVSVPYELKKTITHMHAAYLWRFLRSFKQKFAEKLEMGQSLPITVDELSAIKEFTQFDEMITAPMFGYQDAAHYYDSASCRTLLSRIDIPLMLLHAEDDPLVPRDAVPDTSELGVNTQLLLTKRGGHLGFVSAGSGLSIGGEDSWLASQVYQFLSEDLSD